MFVWVDVFVSVRVEVFAWGPRISLVGILRCVVVALCLCRRLRGPIFFWFLRATEQSRLLACCLTLAGDDWMLAWRVQRAQQVSVPLVKSGRARHSGWGAGVWIGRGGMTRRRGERDLPLLSPPRAVSCRFGFNRPLLLVGACEREKTNGFRRRRRPSLRICVSSARVARTRKPSGLWILLCCG